MQDKKVIDWERIELDYRAGIKSLREIAEENNITHGAVNKRAKRDGWIRDLTAKIRAKADYLVSISEVSSQVSTEKRILESEIVEANARKNADVDGSHRWVSTFLRNVSSSLLKELKDQIDNKDDFVKLGEIMRNTDQNGNDKLNDIYMKAISFPVRVDCIKKLTDSVKTSIDLERRVYKIDDSDSEEEKHNKVSINVNFV